MNDQANIWVRNAPGDPVLKGVNWGGLRTLYIKEVRRFFKVQMQTVWAPAITTLLYLAIFTVALGRGGKMVMGVPFANFIAPGLIVMAMLQNAFANSSFSLLVGKIQGNIVDYLMPPLSTGELIAGLIGAAVTRAFLVGCAVWLAMLLWPGVSVDIRRPELVFWFGLMGALLLSFLGLLTSVWAEKFDHEQGGYRKGGGTARPRRGPQSQLLRPAARRPALRPVRCLPPESEGFQRSRDPGPDGLRMTYAVKECFLTLQGEGVQAGSRAVFLRFAGCNLWSGREQDRSTAQCQFCDTDFVGTDGQGGGKFRSAEDLAAHDGILTAAERQASQQ